MDNLRNKLLAIVGASEEDTKPTESLTQEELLGMVVDVDYRLALLEMGVNEGDMQ